MGRAMAVRDAGKQFTEYTYFPVFSAKEEQIFQGAFGLELDVSSSLRGTSLHPQAYFWVLSPAILHCKVVEHGFL